MDQAFFPGQDFDEGAKVHEPRDFADVSLTDFYVFRQFSIHSLALSPLSPSTAAM